MSVAASVIGDSGFSIVFAIPNASGFVSVSTYAHFASSSGSVGAAWVDGPAAGTGGALGGPAAPEAAAGAGAAGGAAGAAFAGGVEGEGVGGGVEGVFVESATALAATSAARLSRW